MILHAIRIGDRPKSIRELQLFTNRSDVANIQYGVKKLVAAGLIIVSESPEFFSKLLKSDFMKYGKLVKDIGYQPQ